MLHPPSARYEGILERISRLPVIDCHEHTAATPYVERPREPIAWLLMGYLPGELVSAGADGATIVMLQDNSVPTEQKWPVFEALWQRTKHTAYARVTAMALEAVFGEREMSVAALQRVRERLPERDDAFFQRVLEQANIRVVLVDALRWDPAAFAAYLDGRKTFSLGMRLMVPLRLFHVAPRRLEPTPHDWEGVQAVGGWVDRHITSLDGFLEAVFTILKRCKERGAAGIKDQSAYVRSLEYEVVPRADAERIFNRLLNDARSVLGWPEAKPLDDFLFHEYMRFAAELDMPVQLHTGHMAGCYNRVDKANAVHLSNTLELHQRVRFDLFHGNWPYMDELLFLGKNYPNVAIDLCWVPMIDPLYTIELLQRAVVAVPHVKIHGFGGDHVDTPEYSAAHLTLAREAIAAALTGLVDKGWLSERDAVGVAADWLYNNPNAFFRLGCEPIRGDAL